jgi:hypothetical protein
MLKNRFWEKAIGKYISEGGQINGCIEKPGAGPVKGAGSNEFRIDIGVTMKH